MKENWKWVHGWYGVYAVSDHGRIKSFYGGRPRLLKPYLSEGYPSIKIGLGAKIKFHRIHNLVLTTFVSPRPNGLLGTHTNGDQRDNRVTNLAWATPKENMGHKLGHRTGPVDRAAFNRSSFAGLKRYVESLEM